MTDRSQSTEPHAGAPSGRCSAVPCCRPSWRAGRGRRGRRLARHGRAGGALIGLVVSIGFFASGMFLLSRLVRSASPQAFFAVAMSVYLGQVIALLLVIMAFKDATWVDGVALGVVALVVTIVWQGAAMLALRGPASGVRRAPSRPGRRPMSSAITPSPAVATTRGVR